MVRPHSYIRLHTAQIVLNRENPFKHVVTGSRGAVQGAGETVLLRVLQAIDGVGQIMLRSSALRLAAQFVEAFALTLLVKNSATISRSMNF